MKYTYCGRHGLPDNSCYTKQADEVNKIQAQSASFTVTMLNKDETTKREEVKKIMLMEEKKEDESVLTKRSTAGELSHRKWQLMVKVMKETRIEGYAVQDPAQEFWLHPWRKKLQRSSTRRRCE